MDVEDNIGLAFGSGVAVHLLNDPSGSDAHCTVSL
jgi:hypothetical protein